jgi:DNA-binding NarL/FixJ family response regulator
VRGNSWSTQGFNFGQNSENEKSNHSQKTAGMRTSKHLNRRKIFIVEDEILVAENLKEFLQNAGYAVAGIASTGEEAIAEIARTEVDLILMDIRLGGKLSGIETMSVIHATSKEIPVVFVTAYPDDLLVQNSSVSPSLYKYVAKPFSQKDLDLAIRSLLHKQ